MQLIDELEHRLAAEPSLFRAQLLREDIARLRRLQELAAATPDADAYRRAGRRLGWTPMDARTAELGDALDRLIDGVRDALAGEAAADAEARARGAWLELTEIRLERLLGCLSTRVPKLED